MHFGIPSSGLNKFGWVWGGAGEFFNFKRCFFFFFFFFFFLFFFFFGGGGGGGGVCFSEFTQIYR